MNQVQLLRAQIKTSYDKLPEIIRFVLATFWTLIIWGMIVKLSSMLWNFLDKFEWIRQLELNTNKFLLLLPLAIVALLFLAAFVRIVQLLKK